MRTITIYKYDELPEKAQRKAVLEVEYQMRENDWEEAQQWAIDDCSLLEPEHKEMSALFGEDYYERNLTPDGKYGQFVFKNNRKGILFDIESGWLNITEALEITNDKMFMIWLGVPEILHQYVTYEIHTVFGGRQTKLSLSHELGSDDPRAGVLDELFKKAEYKFSSHLEDILQRINDGTESYFDEDNVMNKIYESDYEFYEDGEISG